MDQRLLDAMLLPEPLSRRAWESWRAGVNIQALPYDCQQFLPALNPSLRGWLKGDPSAGIIQGIVRMAWTQNQFRLHKAVEIANALNAAGVQPAAVAGPLACAIGAEPLIRTAPYLSFLVRRSDLRKAADTLAFAGLELCGRVPWGEELDWTDHIWFGNENLRLTLNWRLLATSPHDAAECERAFLSRLLPVVWQKRSLLTIAPEANLLEILCRRREADSIPWQADLALVGATGVNWTRFRKLALRFAPAALERLDELPRGGRFEIPNLASHKPSELRRKIRWFWNEYRSYSYYRKEPTSHRGFLHFLAERLNARSVWRLPFTGVRRAFQQRRTLLR